MKHLLALVAISLVLLVSCNKKESMGASAGADSTIMKNKEAARAIIQDFASDKASATFDKYVDANYNEHTPDDPHQKPGLAGLKDLSAAFHAAFPDIKITITDVIAEGDMVCVHNSISGTNTGSFMGMPATGKKIEVGGIDMMKFSNGKGTDHWGYYEQMKMMMQLGMMPAPGGAPEGKMPEKDMKKPK